jgi:GNAT superfamily N-acetyltransferase
VVHPHYQGRGLGRGLADAIMSHILAQARPGTLIRLIASDEAASFYRRCGWQVTGDHVVRWGP